METALTMYLPLIKFDPVKRLVYGYASTEAIDSQGEIVSRQALKAALPDYMRFANVREMHQLSAVGKTQQALLDEKGLYVVAKIVDDDAWKKVREAVYSGFSIGGKKLAKEGNTITDLTLTEISLVDRPANPECVIELAKVAARDDVDQADKDRAKEQYGDVEFADAKNKKYPIDTEEHIRAAWNYISKPKNQKPYSADDLKTVKDRIVSAWKKKIDKDGPPSAQKPEDGGEKVLKGMYGVAQLAALVDALDQFRQAVQLEAEMENDGSSIPAQVGDCLDALCAVLKDYVAEETGELTSDKEDDMDTEVITTNADLSQVRKAGARHSKDDQAHVDAIHGHAQQIVEHAQALGAMKPDEEDDEKNGEKAARADFGKVAFQAQEMAKEILVTLRKVEAENADLKKRLADLSMQPAAPKAVLKSVSKGDDYQGAPNEVQPKTALEAIKAAHREPMPIRIR